MNEDDHKGIASILNLPRRSPVKTPKVETQEFPSLSLSDAVMRLKPLELPKSEPKDEYGYTKKQNREIERQLTRDKSKSVGAWSAFVKADKDPNRPKNVEPVNYMEQMKTKHGSYDNYSKLENQKIFKNNINNKKIGVLDYIEKVKENYNDTGSENNRYVNKSLNSFENRTDKKDVVTFDPTTQLFTDQTRNIAFKDYHKAKRWNDAINSEDKKDTRKNENVKKINPNRRLI